MRLVVFGCIPPSCLFRKWFLVHQVYVSEHPWGQKKCNHLFFILWSSGLSNSRGVAPSLWLRGSDAEDSTPPSERTPHTAGLSVGESRELQDHPCGGSYSRAGKNELSTAVGGFMESGDMVPHRAQRSWVDLSFKVKMKERSQLHKHQGKTGSRID